MIFNVKMIALGVTVVAMSGLSLASVGYDGSFRDQHNYNQEDQVQREGQGQRVREFVRKKRHGAKIAAIVRRAGPGARVGDDSWRKGKGANVRKHMHKKHTHRKGCGHRVVRREGPGARVVPEINTAASSLALALVVGLVALFRERKLRK